MSFAVLARRPSPAVLVAVLVAVATPAVAGPAAAPAFAGHRAIYDMHLDGRSDRSEIGAVEGRLVYEFSGSRCEGWASRFRLVTRLDPIEGASRLTDLRTSSFEDGDGRSFDFLNENWVDRVKIEESKGRATRDGGVRVRLERPGVKEVMLPAAVRFPTEHLRAVVEAAEAGRSFAEIDLFDGSETGEKPFRTSIVIGHEETGADDTAAEPAAAIDLLKGHRRWPISISFFDLTKADKGEILPDYQLSFLLYDNGVSRRMRFDYGSFTLRGDLASLTPLPAAACP